MAGHEHAHVYSVVLGLSEPAQQQMFVTELHRHDRYKIVNSARNAVLTVELAARIQPDVVILSDLSEGTPGHHVLPDLARHAPGTRVIITVGNEGIVDEATSGVRVINDYDLDALRTALDSTVDMLDNPQAPPERRVLTERRVQQDWTKVFTERRVEVRRQDDLA